MKPEPPPRAGAGPRIVLATMLLLLGLCVGRMLPHWLVFEDGVALLQIGALDLGGAVLVPVGLVAALMLGRVSFSVTLAALLVGLPLAGAGALAEILGGPHLSKMMGLVGCMGVGVGATVAAGERRGAGLLGLAIVGAAAFGLVRIHDATEGLLVAAPYVVVALAALRRHIVAEPRPEPRASQPD
jgi:hypothetical protein